MRRVGARHTKTVEVNMTSIPELSKVSILAFGYEPIFLVKNKNLSSKDWKIRRE